MRYASPRVRSRAERKVVLEMKKSLIGVAATAMLLAAGSVFVPSAAFAVGSTVSWNPSTICPGESTTLTINDQTTGSPVVPATEYWELFADGSSSPFLVSTPGQTFVYLNNNPFSYDWFTLSGITTTMEFKVLDANAPGTLNSATVTLLPECAATGSTADSLPETGHSHATFASLAGFAALIGLGGVALVVARNRRSRASK